MAEKEIKRVITIESSESLNTLNNLNARIKELKGTMGDLDITTEEYRQVSEEVTQLENVKRNAIRGVTAAVEGSYNAYSKELSILQKHRKTLNENTQEYKDMTKRVAELQQKLKDMDADVGVYSRNVGNYSSAFNGLQFSVNQVVRELPVITMGFDRFMLAISNNLPMLFDSIKAYKEMAQGQQDVNAAMMDVSVSGAEAATATTQMATSQQAAGVAGHAMATGATAAATATKALIKALFSWNTLLLVIIVVLQQFADEIQEWVEDLFDTGEQLNATERAMQSFREELKNTELGVGDTIVKVKSLIKAWDGLGESMEAREEFIRQNKTLFDELGIAINDVNEAETFFAEHTDDYIEAVKLRAQADAAKRLAGKEYEEEIKKKREAEAKEEEAEAIRKEKIAAQADKNLYPLTGYTIQEAIMPQEYLQKMAEGTKLRKEAQEAHETADALFDLATSYEYASKARYKFSSSGNDANEDSPFTIPAFKDSRSTRPERISTTTDWGYEGAVDAAAEQEALKATLEARTKMLTANAEERKTIEDQLQQELATIEELRLVNHEIILNELLRDEELTAEERMALEEALTQNKIDQAQLQIEAEENRAKKEKVIRDKEAKEEAEREKQMQSIKANMLNMTTSLIRQSAELFEEDSKERKALNAAAIVMDTYKAAMAAWTAAQGLPPGIGQAVGAANVAASVAMGAMQLANLFKVAPDGSNAEGALSSAQSAPNVASSMPASYTRSLQGDNELTEMNKDTRVYVVESDITNAQKSARVRVESATF